MKVPRGASSPAAGEDRALVLRCARTRAPADPAGGIPRVSAVRSRSLARDADSLRLTSIVCFRGLRPPGRQGQGERPPALALGGRPVTADPRSLPLG
jgi:hypothetical protein